MKILLPFAAATLLTAVSSAQSPVFSMTPAVRLTPAGANVGYGLTAASGTAFAILADVSGGPRDVFGERLYLGLTPAAITLRAGVIAAGSATGSMTIPPAAGIAGSVLYGQAVVLDRNSPNGLFTPTNAASSTSYLGAGAIVADFTDPVANGYVGTFSPHVDGHIAGGAITRRVHRTVDPQGVPFGLPLRNPLNKDGSREQMVFRAQDVGATGAPELVTAISWYSAVPILADGFARFELAIGHTSVAPNYSVDPFTALPVAPNSGLDPLFANNGMTRLVYRGSYVLLPAMQSPSGFVPLPLAKPFGYDGSSSLLLEFRVFPDPLALGINGMYGRLMVQSSPLPAARNAIGGLPAQPLDPSQATVGTGDNWMAELEIEFANVETEATSPVLGAGMLAPDYDRPILAASLPHGTSVKVEYRGVSAVGVATPWSPSTDIADGLPFLQFRITFHADLATGEVPVVDTLVVPYH